MRKLGSVAGGILAPILAMYCASGLADMDGSEEEKHEEGDEDEAEDADDSCCRTLPTVCTSLVTGWTKGYQHKHPQLKSGKLLFPAKQKFGLPAPVYPWQWLPGPSEANVEVQSCFPPTWQCAGNGPPPATWDAWGCDLHQLQEADKGSARFPW